MAKYRVLKLSAHKIIKMGYSPEAEESGDKAVYRINLDNNLVFGYVVDESLLMESCALFDQFFALLHEAKAIEQSILESEEVQEWLLTELVIVDFSEFYHGKTDVFEASIKKLIERGFTIKYLGKEVNMLPFDKSGNMSRKCRLSFINADRLEAMNTRLNIDIDFSEQRLNLSKYYAYRGLYLSTARRINPEKLKITPETLVIIDDNHNKDYYSYRKDVPVEQGEFESEEDMSKLSFKTQNIKREDITVPFDGQGVISPDYAKTIKDTLKNNDINSFQIRLPFAKGMLHNVDFHAFLADVYRANTGNTSSLDDDADGVKNATIKDVFGIERNLRNVKIIMTKSMFKCTDWLVGSRGGEDPMEYYCDAVRKYNHALYVSSTDMPYGNTEVTHTSYQFLNTLDLTDEQFEALIGKQVEYIKDPGKYIEMTKGQILDEEDETPVKYSNWQRAYMVNRNFGNIKYINNQLKNLQASLMTKLAMGKLVVRGQTRFMSRDLPFMLVSLIDNAKTTALKNALKVFHYRFYLPQGKALTDNRMNLEYFQHCGFFRSPHLSRNEQALLMPLVFDEKIEYADIETYKQNCKTICEYFGHLKGIVIFGNESLEPMALGGADFDGDLVNMIVEPEIVEAIKSGVYEKTEGGRDNTAGLKRKESVPYVKIPALKAAKESVPKQIPYEQIKNTFSNKIGLISNAAIAIGQYEYGSKERPELDIKCSECTIYTGLEIDAAKSGKHPDLRRITDNDSIRKCGYLEFKKDFEALRADSRYHFNQLEYRKKGDTHILGIKGTSREIEYHEEAGTYINRLPVKYMELVEAKTDLPKGDITKCFSFPDTKQNEQAAAELWKQCSNVLEIYSYHNALYNSIQNKTNKNYYSEEQLKKLLQKQYDDDVVERIVKEDLPYIFGKIAGSVSSYKEVNRLQKQMNESKWHIMTNEEKKAFLCNVLGAQTIDEEKWGIVLQPYNQNYKVLWQIIGILGAKLTLEYADIKADFKQMLVDELQNSELTLQLDRILEYSMKYKESGVSGRIYNICLSKMREIVEDSPLALHEKIAVIFENTKKDVWKSRFFWDCFEWEELEPYVVKESNYA